MPERLTYRAALVTRERELRHQTDRNERLPSPTARNPRKPWSHLEYSSAKSQGLVPYNLILRKSTPLIVRVRVCATHKNL